MADTVRRVRYAYIVAPNRPGRGAAALGALRQAGVNLLAFSGFPTRRGKVQLDFVPERIAALRKVARRMGWRLSRAKKAFLVRGDDRVGAAHRSLARLAARRINVTAADAIAAGKGRYGMIIWVKPKDYARAARALGAK